MAKITDITVNGEAYDFLAIPRWVRVGTIESGDKMQSLAKKTLLDQDFKGLGQGELALNIIVPHGGMGDKDKIILQFSDEGTVVKTLPIQQSQQIRAALEKAREVSKHPANVADVMRERNEMVLQGAAALEAHLAEDIIFNDAKRPDDNYAYKSLFSVICEAVSVSEKRSLVPQATSHPRVSDAGAKAAGVWL